MIKSSWSSQPQNVSNATTSSFSTNANIGCLESLAGMSKSKIMPDDDTSLRYCDSADRHPTKQLELHPRKPVVPETSSQNQGKQQQEHYQKQHSFKELLEIFKDLPTKEVSDIIIKKKFRQIQQQMKTRGLVTDLSLLQISRDVVATKIIDSVEEAIIRRERKQSP